MQVEHQFQPHRPTLILGLIGFAREAAAAVKGVLATRDAPAVQWRIGELGEADAWWASGARVQLLGDGSLRIGPGEPGARSVRLSLAQVQRPVAFSEPVASREFEPTYTFRVDQPASMAAMLSTMESQWLAPTAARLWIAARLVEAEGALSQRIYHVVGGGRLLAVIDRTGDIGLMPGVKVEHLDRGQWLARPSSAAFIPANFQLTTISEVLWSFALRAQDDLLPAHYRSKPLYFRRPPKLDQRLLGDEHLLVMRELFLSPARFAELQQRTGLNAERLARALAALYLTGSITANRQRVPREPGLPVSAGPQSRQESVWSPSSQSSQADPSSQVPLDFTVPARLPQDHPAGEAAARTEAG
jgi:hypothetical protein